MSETLSQDQVARLEEAKQAILAKRSEILKLQAKLSVELADLDDLEASYRARIDEVPEALRKPYLLDDLQPEDQADR